MIDDKATVWKLMKDFIYSSIKGIMVKYGAYEPNNRQTWENIGGRVREFTEKLSPMGYLHKTRVVCGAENNTEDTIEANELHLQFCWKVKKDDEWTVADFAITPMIVSVSETQRS